MIRLLIISIIFLLLYLGFSALGMLDSKLTIHVYDYYLETTFVTVIVLFIVLMFFSFILLKVIFFILQLPCTIKQLFYISSLEKTNYLLSKSMAEYIMGNTPQATNNIAKISPSRNIPHKEFYFLMCALTAAETEKQIQAFQELEKFRVFAAYATKSLAKIFFTRGLYESAENYASKSYNLYEYDSETLAILIDCYGKLSLYNKLVFVVSKLAKLDPQKLDSMRDRVASYYILAARNMLELQEKEAQHYLESAIKIAPANLEAIDLYLIIDAHNKSSKRFEILKAAFIINPSLEIAKLYKKYMNLPHRRIYEELELLVDPKEHLDLFLSIAAYLDLPDKIQALREQPKLLSYE